jgi:response regulator RpfG family c-di-GMP phosphodiesterase
MELGLPMRLNRSSKTLWHEQGSGREEEGAMPEKILLVDDDDNILEAYRRTLSREFHIDTARGGQEALRLATETGPYAVVVSDMQMPGIDGVQLLSSIKVRWPDTIRVMLTGNADVQTAIDAINEGRIFRFLTKPCSKEAMAKALTAAQVQYRLVTAEKELLEQTLTGCVQVLTEVLSMVNPAAFGRAERARRYIRYVVAAMKLGDPWQYEVAAMMSQLGCVTLPAETIDAVYVGKQLSSKEQALYEAHPHVAYDLLCKIPRLEPVAWMINFQNQPFLDPGPVGAEKADIRKGAEILRLILAYDTLIRNGASRTEAAHTLSREYTDLDPQFFQVLVTLDPNAEEGEVQTCRIGDLVPGMIIQQELRACDGKLLASKGQEITPPLLLKVRNLYSQRALAGQVAVSMPKTTLAFLKGTSGAVSHSVS